MLLNVCTYVLLYLCYAWPSSSKAAQISVDIPFHWTPVLERVKRDGLPIPRTPGGGLPPTSAGPAVPGPGASSPGTGSPGVHPPSPAGTGGTQINVPSPANVQNSAKQLGSAASQPLVNALNAGKSAAENAGKAADTGMSAVEKEVNKTGVGEEGKEGGKKTSISKTEEAAPSRHSAGGDGGGDTDDEGSGDKGGEKKGKESGGEDEQEKDKGKEKGGDSGNDADDEKSKPKSSRRSKFLSSEYTNTEEQNHGAGDHKRPSGKPSSISKTEEDTAGGNGGGDGGTSVSRTEESNVEHNGTKPTSVSESEEDSSHKDGSQSGNEADTSNAGEQEAREGGKTSVSASADNTKSKAAKEDGVRMPTPYMVYDKKFKDYFLRDEPGYNYTRSDSRSGDKHSGETPPLIAPYALAHDIADGFSTTEIQEAFANMHPLALARRKARLARLKKLNQDVHAHAHAHKLAHAAHGHTAHHGHDAKKGHHHVVKKASKHGSGQFQKVATVGAGMRIWKAMKEKKAREAAANKKKTEHHDHHEG